MKKALANLPQSQLLDLARTVQDLEKRVGDRGPQNDDELHAWLLEHLGLDMPRNPVIEGHSTPFWLIADIYFNRTQSAFAIANRGGSKTASASIIHVLNGLYKPEFDSISIGAIMAQSNRAYEHFRKFMREFGTAIATSKISETIFVLGGKLEVVAGTLAACNGPHTQLMHIDELEIFDPAALAEAKNIPTSKKLKNGINYGTQVLFTSTRKRPGGPVQKTLDKIEEAISKGEDPPYKLYLWNCFDVGERVTNCRVANPDLPEEEKCQCHKVVSGKWENGETRTFDQACDGKLARAEGWITLDTLTQIFRTSDIDTWEAQQECLKPSREGLIYPKFNKERHGLRNYQPRPEYGPIYQGIDPGGTNPHAVVWVQVLSVALEVMRYGGKKITIPEGSRVVFKEFYKAEISNSELADEITIIENQYKDAFPGWNVSGRFADPAAKAARLELKKHASKLITTFKATREVLEHIKQVKTLVDNDLLYADLGECPMFFKEIDAWAWEEKKPGEEDNSEKPVKDFDHLMDATRYCIANIAMLLLNDRGYSIAPDTVEHGVVNPQRKYAPKASDMGQESWRKSFGGIPLRRASGRR